MEQHEANPVNSVVVRNLGANVAEKTLADFFSFCGKIDKLSIIRQGEHAVALVTFDTEAAAKTALLLTNAVVGNNPIIVVAYSFGALPGEKAVQPETISESIESATTSKTPEETKSEVPDKSEAQKEESGDKPNIEVTHLAKEEIPVRPQVLPDEERSSTSVVASLLGAGYVLGHDAIAKARQFDDEKGITKTLQEGATLGAHLVGGAVTAIGQKIDELDKSLGIAVTVRATSDLLTQKSNELEIAVKATLDTVVNSPTFVQAMSSVSSWGQSWGQYFGVQLSADGTQAAAPAAIQQSPTPKAEDDQQREQIYAEAMKATNDSPQPASAGDSTAVVKDLLFDDFDPNGPPPPVPMRPAQSNALPEQHEGEKEKEPKSETTQPTVDPFLIDIRPSVPEVETQSIVPSFTIDENESNNGDSERQPLIQL